MTEQSARDPKSPGTVSDLSERDLIARIQQRLPAPPDWVLVGIGDDAAVVVPERNRVEVLSVDCVVDGVHFDRAFVPPDAIGHRALAVNLSDLAAMGATPRLALVSMALPGALPIADFDGIADGLSALAARHATHIIGGNLTRTPGPLSIDITVMGTVKRRQALTRGGARAGDELYVTGSIGGAAEGLHILRSTHHDPRSVIRDPQSALVERYLRPAPRVRVGTLLARNRLASACIDLSDGLAAAARQIAEASAIAVALEADALPIDPAARDALAARQVDPVAEALTEGDDYELLFAVRPRLRRRLEAVLRHADVAVTRIGSCRSGSGATVATTSGAGDAAPLPAGYGHFR
ncbi:MAG TPA: thiamine-phosphate kinase [Vicinamibacterales bacterium]|nr:thiamine-phosphate kinase [Vicinamibacterales bacterium]